MIYSFDVYDTLITRVSAEPAGIFVYMQKILSTSDEYASLPLWFVEDFVRIRREAEIIARKQAGSEEISFVDIYQQLSENHHIPENLCKKISGLEIEMEIKNSLVIQETLDEIEQLTACGERIVLISDMYMDRSFFEKLFSYIHPPLNTYPLYLSSDKAATKASGKLFVIAEAKERVPLNEWVHTGNDFFTDVSVPKLLGMKVNLFQKKMDAPASARIQAIMKDTNNATTQFLHGIQNSPAFLNGSVGYRIGYSFLGMILYDYVKWVVYQAAAMRIDALHFIARDGYLLKQIAETIIAEENFPIRTNYLYGSREAWRTKTNADKELVNAYFQQETLGKEERFAFVDTQGTGVSLDAISCLDGKKIPIFYYITPLNHKSKNTEPHIYSIRSGGRLIEVLCRAPHGRTIGFARQNKSVIPLTEQISDQQYRESGFYDYVEGVMDFVKSVVLFQKRTGISLSFADAAHRGMKYCEYAPDKQLADFLGEIPFDTPAGNGESVFAPLLTEEDIKRVTIYRGQEPLKYIYAGSDLVYSYQRLDQRMQEKLDEYQQAFYQQAPNKAADALHIAIFGCGNSGKHLYRSLYLDEAVIVDRIVDPYPREDAYIPLKIEAISALTDAEFDYVVISNDYISRIESIQALLALAGFDLRKVVSEKTFKKLRAVLEN